MRLSFIVIILLLFSCGDKNISNYIQQVNDRDNVNTTNRTNGNVQLSPSIYQDEFKNFFHKRTLLPDSASSKYQRVISYKTSSKILNHQTFDNGLRVIKIEGVKIVIEEGNSTFQFLTKHSDLKTLIIEAKEVYLKSGLDLSGTNVEISANRLELSKGAYINTSALAPTHKAEQFKDGVDGEKAGNISLNLSHLIIEQSDDPVFILKGGSGQNAGLGQNGENGQSLEDLGDGLIFYSNTYQSPIIRQHPGMFLTTTGGEIQKEERGVNQWPTDGKDALAGGRPGLGGKGGHIVSTLPIKQQLIDYSGGVSGQKAPHYVGGDAGLPNPARKIIIYRIGKETVQNDRLIKETKDGQDIVSPSASSNFGEDGKLIVDREKTWLSLGYFNQMLKYVNDIYYGNHFQIAYNKYQNLFDECIEYKKINIDVTNVCNSISTKIINLTNQKNFFGKDINRVPLLNFETSFSLYEHEIKNAITSLYYGLLLENKNLSTKERLLAISKTQDVIYAQIINDNKAIPELLSKIPELNRSIGELKTKESLFEKELFRVKEEIEHEAKRNVEYARKKQKLFKVLDSIAAVSSVIPIGQPAIGVTTSSFASFMKLNTSGSLIDTVKNVKKIYDKASKEINIEDSARNWNEGFQNIRYSNFKRQLDDISDGEERKKIITSYLKRIAKFSKPIVEKSIEEVKKYKNISFPKDEVEKEIKKLQASDKRFLKLTKILKDILAKRSVIVTKVSTLSASLSQIIESVNNGYNEISSLADERFEVLKKEKVNLEYDYHSLVIESQNRMLRHSYELYNSYQYRQMDNQINDRFYKSIDMIIEHMTNDINISKDKMASQNDIDFYTSMFQSGLSRIVDDSIYVLENNELFYENELSINLNQSQIDTLNAGEDIYIDLMSLRRQFESEENLKIRDVKVNCNFKEDFSSLTISKAEVLIEHGRDNIIEKDGVLYRLHDAKVKRWGTSFDLISKSSTDIRPAESNIRPLATILGRTHGDTYNLDLFFARPSLLGQYKISLKNRTFPNVAIKLNELSITFQYDYQLKKH